MWTTRGKLSLRHISLGRPLLPVPRPHTQHQSLQYRPSHTLTRGSYAAVTETHKQAFHKMLSNRPQSVVSEARELEAYTVDWMHKYKGTGSVALKPKTTEEISQIMSYCNLNKIAVVPQGGNTGLVGGSVPVFDEVVLSLSGLNRIRSFDETSGVIVCDAGCVLESLEAFASERGYTVPLDLGAKGSCQIGGNVATMAGGLRLYRFGNLRNNVLGLEVVLADGTVMSNLNTLRKDNTGIDVKQVFMGSEGTLGVVTAVALGLVPKAVSVQTALFGIPSFSHVIKAQALARSMLNEIVSAIEFFDAESLALVSNQLQARSPLSDAHPFYLLLETRGSNPEHDQQKLMQFLEHALGTELVSDGTVCESATQAKEVWNIREGITESLQKAGAVYKYDVSLPHSHMYTLVEETNKRIREAGIANTVAVGFGHLGDCNLHLNISTPKYSTEVLDLLEPFVYEWTGNHGGSISAEHGIGVMKTKYLPLSKPPAAIELMRSFKKLLDPNAILNPYKVI